MQAYTYTYMLQIQRTNDKNKWKILQHEQERFP